MNWRGRPLTSHEVVVDTIAATTTRTGLTVHAELDPGSYPKGVKITDQTDEALETRRPPATTSTANGTTHCMPNPTRPTPDELIHRGSSAEDDNTAEVRG